MKPQSDRKVQFETSPEKYFGALLERVLRNEAHLQALSEHVAHLIGILEGRRSGEVVDEIHRRQREVFEELSAGVVAKLTQRPADELLKEIDDTEPLSGKE